LQQPVIVIPKASRCQSTCVFPLSSSGTACAYRRLFSQHVDGYLVPSCVDASWSFRISAVGASSLSPLRASRTPS
jgi:hypothetical protein